MYYRFAISLAFMLLVSFSCVYSSNVKIHGQVLDQSTLSPLVSATVSLKKKSDSSIVSGKITDKGGEFVFNGIPGDEYILSVRFIGYDEQLLSLKTNNEDIRLKPIILTQSAAITDEVIVTAEKPLIEYSMGKQIINVDKNLTSSSGNALDVLKQAPSVEVDAEGNVALRGSSNLRVLIDGKPAPQSADNLSNLLSQIPSSSIENIEIITNPSAKYDAEGMSGIINIIMKKKREIGINGLANINVSSGDKYYSGINLNHNSGSINYFGSYDHYSYIQPTKQISSRENYSSFDSRFLDQNTDHNHFLKRNSGKLGFDWSLDEQNTLSSSISYTHAGNKMKGNVDYLFLNPSKQTTSIDERQFFAKQPQAHTEASLNYRRSFEGKSHELTFDAYYSSFSLENETDIRYTFMNADGTLRLPNPLVQNMTNDNIVDTYVLQTDYVLPIGSEMKLESGAKATLRHFDSDYEMKVFDYSQSVWSKDSNSSNNFRFNENVYSVYSMLSGNVDKFGYQIGLRGEYSDTRGELLNNSFDFEKNYLDFFPSLSLSYSINQSNQIQFSYSSRVDRPSIWGLNPFVDKSDPNSYRAGNPDLKPIYTDSYELSYSKFIGSHSITPTLFVRSVSDIITMYSRYDSLENRIYHTYMNYSDGIAYGLDLSYQARLNEFINLGANLSYYKDEVEVNNPTMGKYSKENYSWNGRMNISVSYPKGFMFQVFANYTPKTITPQGSRFENYSVDFAARWDFFENKASLVFKCNNIFDSVKWGGYALGDGFKFTNKYIPEAQVLSLGFTYKINKGAKQQRRKTSTEDLPPAQMF